MIRRFVPAVLFPAVLLTTILLALTGCQPAPSGGEPSPFFRQASLAEWLDREHPALAADGSFIVGRRDASYDTAAGSHHLARLHADLAVLPGREEGLHRDLHERLEQSLKVLGLALVVHEESIAGGTLTVGYQGADVTGWVNLAGVRTGERTYRLDMIITESPISSPDTVD